jgi:hypothetical protein
MLFALTFDILFFGHSPELLSIIGSSLILGSAVYVALMKESAKNKNSERLAVTADEEVGLVAGMDAEEEDIGDGTVMRETTLTEAVPLGNLGR